MGNLMTVFDGVSHGKLKLAFQPYSVVLAEILCDPIL